MNELKYMMNHKYRRYLITHFVSDLKMSLHNHGVYRYPQQARAKPATGRPGTYRGGYPMAVPERVNAVTYRRVDGQSTLARFRIRLHDHHPELPALRLYFIFFSRTSPGIVPIGSIIEYVESCHTVVSRVQKVRPGRVRVSFFSFDTNSHPLPDTSYRFMVLQLLLFLDRYTLPSTEDSATAPFLYTHSMARLKCDMYPDSLLGTQAEIRISFRHATKMHSIARIARLPTKVTSLSIFLCERSRTYCLRHCIGLSA